MVRIVEENGTVRRQEVLCACVHAHAREQARTMYKGHMFLLHTVCSECRQPMLLPLDYLCVIERGGRAEREK